MDGLDERIRFLPEGRHCNMDDLTDVYPIFVLIFCAEFIFDKFERM